LPHEAFFNGLLDGKLMASIRPEEYRDYLWHIVTTTGAKVQELLIVDSVNEWAKHHGRGERNRLTPRAARCFDLIGSDKWLILLAAEITPQMQKSIRGRLQTCGYDISPIAGERPFLTHLLLHEVAHTLHPDASEDECDEWAFAQLSKYAV
jgi:hypothetical protein